MGHGGSKNGRWNCTDSTTQFVILALNVAFRAECELTRSRFVNTRDEHDRRRGAHRYDFAIVEQHIIRSSAGPSKEKRKKEYCAIGICSVQNWVRVVRERGLASTKFQYAGGSITFVIAGLTFEKPGFPRVLGRSIEARFQRNPEEKTHPGAETKWTAIPTDGLQIRSSETLPSVLDAASYPCCQRWHKSSSLKYTRVFNRRLWGNQTRQIDTESVFTRCQVTTGQHLHQNERRHGRSSRTRVPMHCTVR